MNRCGSLLVMFRLRALSRCTRRLQHGGTVNRDHVLEQLRICSGEEEVFEVVGKNKAKLTVSHVGFAMGILWQFQKEKPKMLQRIEFIRRHPQFLTLQVLAENKIALMDNDTLVDMLYDIHRLNVEPHHSLVQQLVTEIWLRLNSLQMPALSKFANCLYEQNLNHSPLIGQITEILNQKLDSIKDIRVLTVLMISTCSFMSPRLRDALIVRAEVLLDTADPSQFNSVRRTVQFLRNVRYRCWPLLEKCNRLVLHNIPNLNVEDICIIANLYQSLQFSNYDFSLAAKLRLMELVDSSTDALSFTKLFTALAPMAGPETREGLEKTALLLADEFNAQQALVMAETLESVHCRNLHLINKISSIIHKNLDIYKPVEIARVTQALVLLHSQGPELFTKLRSILVRLLQKSVFPDEVTMLTKVLSMLPYPRLDEGVLARVDAVLPQCNLSNLNTYAVAVAKWVRNEPPSHHSIPSRYVHLLLRLNQSAHQRLRTAGRLDELLEELRFDAGEWFEEMLLADTMATLERLSGQVCWANAPELASLLARNSYLVTPLLDRIASVTMENIDKIHYSTMPAILQPFAGLNYDPPRVDDFFDTCVQCFTPHINSFEPRRLVLLAHTLAVADCFPEELSREIFNVNFLAKLDAQLESLADGLNMHLRLRLMELNRAVCLECPEFQVPWFHERYCQRLQRKRNGFNSPVHKQIHKMLVEVLGGYSFTRAAVLTPYFYTVDFEFVLDRHHQPVAYSELGELQISENGKIHWGSESVWKERNELPPGAQRVAVDFLDSKSFCKNSRQMKGESVMKKRHLEILGYHVVQIPHFEWNSMELSTKAAWKEYLRKKIFTELT